MELVGVGCERPRILKALHLYPSEFHNPDALDIWHWFIPWRAGGLCSVHFGGLTAPLTLPVVGEGHLLPYRCSNLNYPDQKEGKIASSDLVIGTSEERIWAQGNDKVEKTLHVGAQILHLSGPTGDRKVEVGGG